MLCLQGLARTTRLLNQSEPLLIAVHNHPDAAETALRDGFVLQRQWDLADVADSCHESVAGHVHLARARLWVDMAMLRWVMNFVACMVLSLGVTGC